MEAYQEQVLAFLKGELSVEEKRVFEDTLARSGELRAELERSREVLELMDAANEQATAHRVERQIREALRRSASDIHVVPGTQETVVHLRIDGALNELERIPKELTQPVVDRWKVLSDCSLTDRQLPQEGRILTTYDGRDFDLRVTIVPTVLGERVTARIIFKSGELLGLDQLGFTEPQLQALRRLLRQPNGLIVAAGPGGSGKTTILYGMLLDLQASDRARANIMTVEEPVETVLDGISQTRVKRSIGLTYAAALRAVYRSDLDVVMIGDLPDRETAELALHMVTTGHLVLVQMTAYSALSVIQRLRDLGAESFLIAQALTGSVVQRLARRVCRECTQEYEPDPHGLQRLGLTPADGPFRRGGGCEACRRTGYKGRIALHELLEANPSLTQLIADGAPLETLWQETFGSHGGSLWDDAREKILQGLTTVEEAHRVLFDYPFRPSNVEAA